MSGPWYATPIGVIGYNAVTEPTTSRFNDKLHYFLQFGITRKTFDSEAWVEILEATKKFAVTELGPNAADLKLPISPVNSGAWPDSVSHYFNVQSGKDFPPKVIRDDGSNVTDKREVYPGILGRISFNLFAWNKSGRKGISYSLLNVQIFPGSGTRMRGARPAGEEFGGLPPLSGDDAIDSIL